VRVPPRSPPPCRRAPALSSARPSLGTMGSGCCVDGRRS
jgi:hypothetical protein